jgi:hypothetical protein
MAVSTPFSGTGVLYLDDDACCVAKRSVKTEFWG